MLRVRSVVGLAVMLASIATGTLAAQPKSCRPTMADFKALKKGDPLKSIVRRLGCRGERLFSMRMGRRLSTSYTWRGEGSFGANLTLSFDNGRLSDKSQLGLE